MEAAEIPEPLSGLTAWFWYHANSNSDERQREPFPLLLDITTRSPENGAVRTVTASYLLIRKTTLISPFASSVLSLSAGRMHYVFLSKNKKKNTEEKSLIRLALFSLCQNWLNLRGKHQLLPKQWGIQSCSSLRRALVRDGRLCYFFFFFIFSPLPQSCTALQKWTVYL